jgi:uncharacterized membrane protein YhaH (DUF805 family)
MSFGQAVQSMFNNYANFNGRASRSAYWWVVVFNILVAIVAMILDNMLGLTFSMTAPTGETISLGYGYIYLLAMLGLLIPNLALSFRRLHDRDKSAWWLLLCFIPLVGGIILLVWYCMRGTVGDNRFGPDPLASKSV